jgi:hypothetical protein
MAILLPMAEMLTVPFFNSTANSKRKQNCGLKTAKLPPGLVVTFISSSIDCLGAYTYIERSYEDCGPDTVESAAKKCGSASDCRPPSPPPDNKLDPSVQALVSLIFDVAIV